MPASAGVPGSAAGAGLDTAGVGKLPRARRRRFPAALVPFLLAASPYRGAPLRAAGGESARATIAGSEEGGAPGAGEAFSAASAVSPVGPRGAPGNDLPRSASPALLLLGAGALCGALVVRRGCRVGWRRG